MHQFIVTYGVYQDGNRYCQFFFSSTSDLAENLRTIVGRRGKMQELLASYKRDEWIRVPSKGTQIGLIHIQPFSEPQAKILGSLFWPEKLFLWQSRFL